MSHSNDPINLYGFTATLLRLWTKAEALYREGNREPEHYFDGQERAVLASLGLGVMDIYDYVEDFVTRGEPDFASFILITGERVFYFFDEMQGKPSDSQIKEADLPPKTDEVAGIPWLPRILMKAKGKLRGELPPEIMYGCGGDRKFARSHGIHLAEFLKKVRSSGDDQEVIDWVASRSPADAAKE